MKADAKCKAEMNKLLALQTKHGYMLKDTGKTLMVRNRSTKMIVPYIVVQFAVPSDSGLGKEVKKLRAKTRTHDARERRKER